MAVDSSVLSRLRENRNLIHAIGTAPALGHGLGYAYQAPSGKPGFFEATLGTTYAHNFYLWLLVKAGVLGMIGFGLFAVVPVARALRTASVEAKAAAIVAVSLLTICVVNPLPLGTNNALALGMSIGAAMAFGRSATSRGRCLTQECLAVAPVQLPPVESGVDAEVHGVHVTKDRHPA
jgi:O-antigen ligase